MEARAAWNWRRDDLAGLDKSIASGWTMAFTGQLRMGDWDARNGVRGYT